MTTPSTITITYPELLARFAPEVPTVPVFRRVLPSATATAGILECYFPAWTPAAEVEARRERLQAYWHRCQVVVFLVTDVPREQLFGDWKDDA